MTEIFAACTRSFWGKRHQSIDTSISLVALSILLGACGGGGGYDSTASTNSTPVDGTPPVATPPDTGTAPTNADTPASPSNPAPAPPSDPPPPNNPPPPTEPPPPNNPPPPTEPPPPNNPPLPTEPPPPNNPPLPNDPLSAEAGIDQSVSELTEVVLDGSASNASTSIQAYSWTQLAGPTVSLDDPASARVQFLAPSRASSVTLEFRLTVTDANGNAADDLVSVDVHPSQDIPSDPNRFLSYLNSSQALYVGSEESAQAYYSAVDPAGLKTSLGDWIAANGFGTPDDIRAVYQNAADLGFGRVMRLRTNADGSVAAYVENYPTLEAAVVAVETGVRAELLATVAMEYSPAAVGGEMITKFFTYGGDDARITSIDLDGRGAKFVPGLCNVCHGGEPTPLVNGVYQNSGNTNAQFLPWDLDTYEFSNTQPFTRAAQEAALKALNVSVLSTHPPAGLEGSWSGTAARELVEGWYGGPSMPAATFDGNYVPVGWRSPENGGPVDNPGDADALYLDVIGPNCRACHIERGRSYSEHEQSEFIDFSSYEKFMAFQAQTAELVFDQGKMPDALVTFDNFWSNQNGVVAAERLANHLGIDAINRRPGRPIADPGPDHSAEMGLIQLSGAGSDFAENYSWSFAPGGRPAGSGATVVGETTVAPSFTADVPGSYRLQLIVDNGQSQSAPETVSILSTFGVTRQSFSQDTAPILMSRCAACHSEGGPQSIPGIVTKFNDPATVHETALAYVNLDDVEQSILLNKPSGQIHGGGTVPGFDLSGNPGADRSDYDAFVRWIAEGAAND